MLMRVHEFDVRTGSRGGHLPSVSWFRDHFIVGHERLRDFDRCLQVIVQIVAAFSPGVFRGENGIFGFVLSEKVSRTEATGDVLTLNEV